MEFDKEYRRLMEAYNKDVSNFHNFFNELSDYQSNHYGTYDSSRLRDEYLKLPEDFKRMMRLPKSQYKNCYRGDDGKNEKPVLSFVWKPDAEKARQSALFWGHYAFSLLEDIKNSSDVIMIGFDRLSKYFGKKITYRITDEYGIGDDENEVLVFDAVFREREQFDEEYRRLMSDF
jgi:hypothetical protein